MRVGAGRCLFIALAGSGIVSSTALIPSHQGFALAGVPTEASTTTTTTTAAALGRNYLNGVYADPPDTVTPALLGGPWDYTINNSYQENCRGCGVSGLAGLDRYPVIVDLNHVQSSYPDFAAAAAGAYNHDYRRTAHLLVPYASQIYAVRIDSEFNGSWSAATPFKGWQAVAASTWIAGFRNLAAAVREALPGVKIVWNPAIGQHDPFPYFPGDDVVDLIGPDIYCQPAYSSTSAACWDEVLQGAHGSNLETFTTFSEAHHKPIVIPEWGDAFGDGVLIRHMREWMDNNPVVAQSYWDSGDALQRTAALTVLTVNQRAYVDAFGNRPYTGSYWHHRLSAPATLRPH